MNLRVYGYLHVLVVNMFYTLHYLRQLKQTLF